MRVTTIRRAAPLALALALAACPSGDSVPGERGQAAAATTTTRAPATTSTLGTATAPGCPTIPARVEADPARPKYTLAADVRPLEGTVDGQLRVVFTPDQDTDRLVFRLWPNGPRPSGAGAAPNLDAGPVTVGNRPATTALEDPTTLVVRTGATFRAHQAVEVSMPWRLQVPGPANDRVSRDGDAMRLGSFFPILPWEPGLGWATEAPAGGFAEASSAPTADFDLTVTVPEGFNVLASGTPDPSRPGRYTAAAMRDVAVSVGRFQTLSAVAMAPNPVQVTVGVHRGVTDAGAGYLDTAVRSLQDFGRRFGAYPWSTFTLSVTPALGGGIEYPTHVMQGPGTTGIVSHEVGHQWFYGLVGNNQGRDPWLDEGLATWADARFEGRLERYKARIISPVAKNLVGEPMSFWADKGRVYTDGVYVQGAQALAALGEPDLVDCALRLYVAVNAYRIARQPDLVRAAAAVFPDAAATLRAYGVKA